MMINHKLLALGSALALICQPALARADIALDLGPFNIDFGQIGGGGNDGIGFIEDSICRGIHRQSLLEVVVDAGDKKVERLVIEPYLLGYNKDGALVLRGFQITDWSLPKEGGGGKGEEKGSSQGMGFVAGVLTVFKGSEKAMDLKMQSIRNIRVIRNSHFKIRSREELGKDEEIVRPLCSIFQ